MLTRSRVIAGASGLAGEPADEPLPGGVPMWLRYETAADLETELIRDYNLSVQNRTMSKYSTPLNFGERELTLTQSGLENAVYATVVNADIADQMIPLPVDITNISTIDIDARDGKRSIAFYSDKPQKAVLSWLPDGGETLTLWYDRSPVTDPDATQSSLTISDSYVPLLKLLLAAQMLELMGKEIGEMLKGRITRGLKQWEDFVASGRQQGVIEKPVYRSGRHRTDISQWDASPGKVYFE